MHKSLKYLVLLSLLVTSACARPTTTVRRDASFNQQDLRVAGLTILPTEATVNTVSVSGAKERMYEYEEHMETLIDAQLLSSLKENGYPATLLAKRDIHDQHISAQVLKLREHATMEMQTLYSTTWLPEEKAFAISSNIGAKNIDNTESIKKYLLLSNYSLLSKTNGARAFGFMMDVMVGTSMSSNSDSSTLTLAIVDNDTGAIVWSNMNPQIHPLFGSFIGGGKKSSNKDEAHVKESIERTLKPLFADNNKEN